MDLLQLEESEFNIIQTPHKGECLYKCGNERYDLLVTAPAYKEKSCSERQAENNR